MIMTINFVVQTLTAFKQRLEGQQGVIFKLYLGFWGVGRVLDQGVGATKLEQELASLSYWFPDQLGQVTTIVTDLRWIKLAAGVTTKTTISRRDVINTVDLCYQVGFPLSFADNSQMINLFSLNCQCYMINCTTSATASIIMTVATNMTTIVAVNKLLTMHYCCYQVSCCCHRTMGCDINYDTTITIAVATLITIMDHHPTYHCHSLMAFAMVMMNSDYFSVVVIAFASNTVTTVTSTVTAAGYIGSSYLLAIRVSLTRGQY